MTTTSTQHKRNSRRRILTLLPSFGASLLPVGVCPACWPAYAGVLSSVGLGFLLQDSYLLALNAALFGVVLLTLARKDRSRRGYGPFALGVVAASIALVGKFAYSSDYLLYVGLGLLVASSVWNAWPKRVVAGSCKNCTGQ